MSYMLLIAEPVGQRAERSQAEGKLLYESMVEFGAGLKERGLLIASESLSTGGVRVKKRDGQASLIDGPFAEAKEMIGGFYMLDCATKRPSRLHRRAQPPNGARSRCARSVPAGNDLLMPSSYASL